MRYCYSKSSVRLSVTLMYRVHISRVSSKVITQLISLAKLASSLLGDPTSAIQSNGNSGEHLQNSGGIGVGSLFSTANLQYLKRGKIGPRLLLMTNRTLLTRFRLVPKSAILNELEGPLRTLFQNTCFFGAHHENLNADRPHNNFEQLYSLIILHT